MRDGAGRRILARTDRATLVCGIEAWWMGRVSAQVKDRDGVIVANLYLRDTTLTLPMAFPVTVAAALAGRPLSDVVDLSSLIERPHTPIVSVQCVAARAPSQLFKPAGHATINWPTSASPGSSRIIVADLFRAVGTEPDA